MGIFKWCIWVFVWELFFKAGYGLGNSEMTEGWGPSYILLELSAFSSHLAYIDTNTSIYVMPLYMGCMNDSAHRIVQERIDLIINTKQWIAIRFTKLWRFELTNWSLGQLVLHMTVYSYCCAWLYLTHCNYFNPFLRYLNTMNDSSFLHENFSALKILLHRIWPS